MTEEFHDGVPQVNRWLISISVVTTTFMEVLDTTVVNVSLPHIGGSMSATVEEATWVLTSYLVANAIILPITGWLARFFGRKRLLLMAVTGFTGASILCGLAPNLSSLIVFRVMQGMSGGTMQPLSQAIMLEAFPPEDRGKAMAFWGLCIVVAPILGPVLGGWMTDTYSWRWVFYINIPVGVTTLLMARMFVFDPPYLRRESARVDYWGIGMLAVGMGALQVFLDKGEQEDWFASGTMTALAVVAAVMLATFIIYELLIAHPVINLRIFKNRTYAAGVFMGSMLGFMLYGSLILLPIMLQTLLGYPALQAGIAMAPRGIGSLIATPVIGILLGRLGARQVLAFGVATVSLTLIWLGQLNLNAGYWDVFWPQFIQGVAFGCLFAPLTTITMDPISREQTGNATSLFNVMRNIGGSSGIAIATTLLARRRQMHTNVLVGHIHPYSGQANVLLGQIRGALVARGADPATATRQSYGLAWGMVQRQAAMMSFIDLFRTMGAVFLLMIPVIWVAKQPRLRKPGAPSPRIPAPAENAPPRTLTGAESA
ncbi:MAG: drug resistance transporter, EmrB/QacA subfamily [Acidobacteria bacterium]|nr:drug resistance transporter, EmrB/QacA subfamily [Acidobacteriota bacterium]